MLFYKGETQVIVQGIKRKVMKVNISTQMWNKTFFFIQAQMRTTVSRLRIE